LGIIDRVRAAIPEAAITTDVIVGFPGETEADFLQTMDLIEQVRFANVFTFIYSKRPGTPAAEMANQIPEEVKQDRYERLAKRVNEILWEENQAQIGNVVEVLVATGEGKKDKDTGRMSGRARDNRLVHFVPIPTIVPGDIVEVEITGAAPFHLISDKPILTHRRTPGSQVATGSAVNIGMPSMVSPK
jgi:tRNA-2-methylthio-N6-dimethylallyladenosine synthase